MDRCILCFDEMDMLGYQDERIQTATCYKLSCGHAYHVACIIPSLTFTNFKCPQCNKEKGPSEQLTRDGLAARLIKELKRDETIKGLTGEFKEAKQEYSETLSQFKKEIKEFVNRRHDELCMGEKRKYMLECLAHIQSTTKKVAKEKGDEYLGALHDNHRRHRRRYWGASAFDHMFFGESAAYSIHRLKRPHLYLDLT